MLKIYLNPTESGYDTRLVFNVETLGLLVRACHSLSHYCYITGIMQWVGDTKEKRKPPKQNRYYNHSISDKKKLPLPILSLANKSLNIKAAITNLPLFCNEVG